MPAAAADAEAAQPEPESVPETASI
eukprot:COSAG02_NODE_61427_length_268_cov_1.189349_1_plen_24_part_10